MSDTSSDHPAMVTIPSAISTGCPELDLVWARYANLVIDRPGIAIPDTDVKLHGTHFWVTASICRDFRAAEFAGVDALTRRAPGFISLRERGIGVPQLATLWEVAAIQGHLLDGIRGLPLSETLDVLRSDGGSVGASLAAAFDSFPYRKGHWTVRALLENSAMLADCGYSFRQWLCRECARLGIEDFPPPDFCEMVRVR